MSDIVAIKDGVPMTAEEVKTPVGGKMTKKNLAGRRISTDTGVRTIYVEDGVKQRLKDNDKYRDKIIGEPTKLLFENESVGETNKRPDFIYEGVDSGNIYVIEVQLGIFDKRHCANIQYYHAFTEDEFPEKNIVILMIAEDFAKEDYFLFRKLAKHGINIIPYVIDMVIRRIDIQKVQDVDIIYKSPDTDILAKNAFNLPYWQKPEVKKFLEDEVEYYNIHKLYGNPMPPFKSTNWWHRWALSKYIGTSVTIESRKKKKIIRVSTVFSRNDKIWNIQQGNDFCNEFKDIIAHETGEILFMEIYKKIFVRAKITIEIPSTPGTVVPESVVKRTAEIYNVMRKYADKWNRER
jgi:hypothetical protein